MSWVKNTGQNPPSTQPQVQMYNPNQHSNQETNQWQQPQGNWYNQPPRQDSKTPYWQQGYNQNQQYGQYPQYYQNNAGYQQPGYGNLQYNQQYSENNFGAQAQTSEGDGWGTNWSWGDEDNSNTTNTNVQNPSSNVTESFATEEAWNWSVEDPKPVENELKPTPLDPLRNKRNKLETPQWSVESQLSQESSDDVLQTSESDKSRMLSRSSTISHSPISGQDPLNHPEVTQEKFENKEILSHMQEGAGISAPPLGAVVDDKNPYKRNTGLSHKGANKFRTSVVENESRVFQPAFHGQGVNLETLPDNSEQPDPIIPSQPTRKVSSSSHPWPENNEAPINDRNQYLETAQLSDVDLNNYNRIPESVTQDNDTLPPPGLRRMVPGQTVNAPETTEPPEGLRRMIPGESSPPEVTLRPQIVDSAPEINEERSATIGADTPPVVPGPVNNIKVNRSETIGADTSPDPTRGKKREEVEGQIQDEDVAGLVNSVRNLAVGEKEEGNSGRGSKGESSGSEEIRGKSPERRRYKEKERDGDRERNRDRNRYGGYSPDDYNRDKKYDKRRGKERRYEDEGDYFSDQDRDRRHRDDREYDRKYSSIRKEKERERRRKEYDRNPRKNDYYYGRYEDEFENESRSRASSRSDSVHDPYSRERGHDRDRRDRRHKEKDRHRRHRDPYNPYQNYSYDIYSQYYQQYQYYENLRKTNPQAYAQLYRKYYQEAGGEGYAEDRASVHSGRSSANDELGKDSFTRTFDQTDASLNCEDSHSTQQRLTPAKFATAHIKVSISSGKLVRILPHYPLDGQAPTVELCNFEALLCNDDDFQELKRFPGPLVKGTTHKKTIIEYCECKIKRAGDVGDREAYVLMWELLILLIRQNGMVVGADIAELLLKNRPQETQRPSSAVSSLNSNVAEPDTNEVSSTTTSLKEDEITNRFREYLLYGSDKEALEWAMKHGLWGHALFLASKLDKRTYANVMMRFANGLTMNDPLQTLYQLLSGRTPAAVTCVADEKWGDWRPHLAMILSNSTQRPELNCKSITILGDTLMARGSLFAAQFCYLMAEVNFGQYGSTEAKLVLLGSNHNETFAHFATNEAIHMTEIYEYARSLNDDEFGLGNFQRYKYLLSTRLADVGLLEKSLSYLEKISTFIVKNSSIVDLDLINDVTSLADRLKFYDPVGDGEADDLDSSRVENTWLKDLRRVLNDHQTGMINSNAPAHNDYAQNENVWQQQAYDQYQPQPQWGEQGVEVAHNEVKQPEEQQQEGFVGQYQDQQQQHFWPGQPQWGGGEYRQEAVEQQNYYGTVAQTEENPTQPQISLPNQQRERTNALAEESVQNESKKEQAKPKETEPLKDKQAGNGWFGGIFSKLSLKPKNQMKLPDDKNPTILWDSEKKRWVNTDPDNGDGSSDFKPPPKMVAMLPKSQPIHKSSFATVVPKNPTPELPHQNETIPNQPNMFKMQRNRNLKKSYIDVFNPNAKPGQASLPPPAPVSGGSTQRPMNFFVPQPISDPNAPTDFLTPAPALTYDENAQMGQQ